MLEHLLVSANGTKTNPTPISSHHNLFKNGVLPQNMYGFTGQGLILKNKSTLKWRSVGKSLAVAELSAVAG